MRLACILLAVGALVSSLSVAIARPSLGAETGRPPLRISDRLEKMVGFILTSARAEGFDSVLVISARIKNFSEQPLKDPVIKCSVFAPSGTKLGTRRQTFYELLPPRKEIRMRNFNMGFVNSQWSRANCEVVGVGRVASVTRS